MYFKKINQIRPADPTGETDPTGASRDGSSTKKALLKKYKVFVANGFRFLISARRFPIFLLRLK